MDSHRERKTEKSQTCSTNVCIININCVFIYIYLCGRSVCGTRSQLTDVYKHQRKSEVIERTSEIVLKTRSRGKDEIQKLYTKTAARTYELKKRVFHRQH